VFHGTVATVSVSDADFDVYLYSLSVYCVHLGSVLVIFIPLKCLSKETMDSSFVYGAEA